MTVSMIRLQNSVQWQWPLLANCRTLLQSQQLACRSMSDWSSDDRQFLHKSNVHSMHFQKSLLRLPVPDLEKTCSRYLLCQKALLSDTEYKATETEVQHFQQKTGPPLQEELKTKDKNNKHTNYISSDWFDMYLKDRASVVLNYNPFLVFMPPEPPFNDPIIRATNLLVSSARFMRTLRAGILEPEVYHLNPSKSDTPFFRKLVGWTPEMFASYPAYAMKAFPLDMSQFGNLLNSTRLPMVGRDTLSSDDTARHTLVMKNGNFYVFDILDQNGLVYPPAHLHACLAHIARDATPRPEHPLGYLTAEDRDVWAKARAELVSAGNEESLRCLDHAAFNLVLDDAVVGTDPEKCYRTFLYGDGGNRWFDKSFSLLFTRDGMAALNFEHSWGDGVAVMRYFNEVCRDGQKNTFVGGDSVPADIDPAKHVRKLEFTLPDTVRAAIESARATYDSRTSALGVHVLESDVIGKELCKTHKVSPDAVMQLGFQLAYRKQYGEVVATYESCSTSAFKHGRTETVRPATLQTKAFTDAVCSGRVAPSAGELKRLVMECSVQHGELTKQAAMGQGFDRHLYGLRKLAENSGSSVPGLYQDPSYAKINHNILSTSTLPSNLISFGGFAPVVTDGYGVGYQIQDSKLGIVLSSYPPHRDGAEFVACAAEAYTVIRDALTS